MEERKKYEDTKLVNYERIYPLEVLTNFPSFN